MGVQGGEWGKVTFDRCQGHPVQSTQPTSTHTYTHKCSHAHKEDVDWTMDRSQECKYGKSPFHALLYIPYKLFPQLYLMHELAA